MTLVALGVSYFGNRFADHYRERDLPAIVDAGCDFVVHTFSEHDHTYYPEALRALVTATHDAGLQAWVDAAAATGADVVFWDAPRCPTARTSEAGAPAVTATWRS